MTAALTPGDALILCSDGLWEMVRSPEQIVQVVDQCRTAEEACRRLVDEANQAGGEDNISVVIARLVPA